MEKKAEEKQEEVKKREMKKEIKNKEKKKKTKNEEKGRIYLLNMFTLLSLPLGVRGNIIAT